MLLFELEDTMIKPLSRADKFQLLLDITRMLQDEERSETSNERTEWEAFVDRYSGCFSDAPIERGAQGVYEIREELA